MTSCPTPVCYHDESIGSIQERHLSAACQQDSTTAALLGTSQAVLRSWKLRLCCEEGTVCLKCPHPCLAQVCSEDEGAAAKQNLEELWRKANRLKSSSELARLMQKEQLVAR